MVNKALAALTAFFMLWHPSPCGAQEAKEIANYSLQLELAIWATEIAPDDGWAHGQVGDAYFCLYQYENALKEFKIAGNLGEVVFLKLVILEF